MQDPGADIRYSLNAPICADVLSHAQLFVTQWTLAHQAPLSMELSRQEYWSGLPFPFPGDLPDPGMESESPVSPALGEKKKKKNTPVGFHI